MMKDPGFDEFENEQKSNSIKIIAIQKVLTNLVINLIEKKKEEI